MDNTYVRSIIITAISVTGTEFSYEIFYSSKSICKESYEKLCSGAYAKHICGIETQEGYLVIDFSKWDSVVLAIRDLEKGALNQYERRAAFLGLLEMTLEE